MDPGEDCHVLLWRAKQMTVVEGRVTAVAIRVPVSAHYFDIANESVLYLAFGASTNASSAANATSKSPTTSSSSPRKSARLVW
jgi:hypothetical protein